ncbi:hypothetical protein EVAR_17329_1 [Eumeta japonica]|uniref:Uncharacterized protein n=1 Tax=Eumeta variegata TaxID=151549 RepID=A0A4C1TT70_EUMVA|nr:hypothetical protein EVAR_17329_1 [Eumeta japonica]
MKDASERFFSAVENHPIPLLPLGVAGPDSCRHFPMISYVDVPAYEAFIGLLRPDSISKAISSRLTNLSRYKGFLVCASWTHPVSPGARTANNGQSVVGGEELPPWSLQPNTVPLRYVYNIPNFKKYTLKYVRVRGAALAQALRQPAGRRGSTLTNNGPDAFEQCTGASAESAAALHPALTALAGRSRAHATHRPTSGRLYYRESMSRGVKV